MACDFSSYNSLRAETATKSDAAAAACVALVEAEAALSDAQTDVNTKTADKTMAYAEWETAERAENAEATNLGIAPCVPSPQ